MTYNQALSRFFRMAKKNRRLRKEAQAKLARMEQKDFTSAAFKASIDAGANVPCIAAVRGSRVDLRLLAEEEGGYTNNPLARFAYLKNIKVRELERILIDGYRSGVTADTLATSIRSNRITMGRFLERRGVRLRSAGRPNGAQRFAQQQWKRNFTERFGI